MTESTVEYIAQVRYSFTSTATDTETWSTWMDMTGGRGFGDGVAAYEWLKGTVHLGKPGWEFRVIRRTDTVASTYTHETEEDQ